MASFPVILHFSVRKNGSFCLISCHKDAGSTTLFLQGWPKALHHRMVVAISCFTHTCLNIVLLQDGWIPVTGIFPAAIGMVEQASCRVPAWPCHLSCCFYQCCIMILVHWPSNNFPRLRIKHTWKIEPPFLCFKKGQVGHPFFLGGISGTISFQ